MSFVLGLSLGSSCVRRMRLRLRQIGLSQELGMASIDLLGAELNKGLYNDSGTRSNPRLVSPHLAKHRMVAKQTMPKHTNRPNKTTLSRLYIDEKKNADEIGKYVGASAQTVYIWLEQAGLRKRRRRNVYRLYYVRPPDFMLFIWYVIEGRSMQDIANVVGTTKHLVRTLLHDAGISSRKVGRNDYKNKPTKEELHQMYSIEKLSAHVIGSKIGVDKATIYNWLNEYGIYIRPPVASMPFDGRSSETKRNNNKYCHLWNEELRESVREKHNRMCFICGKSEEDNGVKLSVHHTNYGRMCMCDYGCRFVPLCRECHGRTNYNRHRWFSLIMCKLYLESSAQFLNIVNDI